MRSVSGPRDTSALLVGGVAGQAALAVAAPVLTRLYSPAEIGLYTAAAALGAIAATVAGGRYDQLIPAVHDHHDARALYALASRLAIVSAVVATAIAWIVLPTGADRGLVFGVGALTVAGAHFQARTFYGMRLQGLTRVGGARATQGVLTASLQAALGYSRLGSIGLLLADAVGRAVGARVAPASADGSRPPLTELADAAGRHRRQATVMVPAVLANMVSVQLPLLLAPIVIGESASGQYALSFRVVYAPTALLASALAAQFFTRASASLRADDDRLPVITRGFVALAAQFALPVALFGAALSPGVFPWVFGADWETAGQVAVPIAIWAAINLVGSTVAGVLVLVGREALAFRLTVLDLAATSVAIAVAAVADVGVVAFGVLVSAASAVVAVVSTLSFLRASGPAGVSGRDWSGLATGLGLAVLWLPPVALAVYSDDLTARTASAAIAVGVGIVWVRHILRALRRLPG